MSILKTLYSIKEKVEQSEAKLWKQNYNSAQLVLSEVSKNWQTDQQQPALFGIHKALVVDTIDPLGMGRVRFYCPLLHDPELKTKQLPFARPISAFGGFDDSGVNWVPPAGSTIVIVFEGGQRTAPYYIGTVWSRDRGQPPHDFGVPIEEFDKYHSGTRDGYLVGEDNSQIFPPWNTENLNLKDIDSEKEFNEDPDAQRKAKIAHLYGFKTNQKHRFKMDDGTYECNFRWKRVELASGNGNWLMFKDDHLHTCGQWAHPDCGCGGGDLSDCTDDSDNPKEMPTCGGNIDGGSPDNQEMQSQTSCANPNSKRKEECRPYKGPGTPENNKCELYQTGVQVMSISGHTMLFDDSVEQPQGSADWHKFLDSFDFGCNDRFMGKICIKSATGHVIELNDIEDEPEIKKRGEKNGVKIETASGHSIKMLDHTLRTGLGGSERGIEIESTSKHHLIFKDEENDQKSEDRKSGGIPEAKAKKAYVELKSGYGLELRMEDASSQEETQNQFIRLKAPQKDNEEKGEHVLLMQEQAEGPGQVLLRAGGTFVGISTDEWVEIIGTEDNPSSKVENITDSKVVSVGDTYINTNIKTLFVAEETISLLAGLDCEGPEGPFTVPCAAPVVVLNPSTGKLGLSSRIIGSIRPDDPDVTIGMLAGAF